MYLDRIALDALAPAIERLFELCTRQNRAGTCKKCLEQRKFASRERDELATHAQLACRLIELKLTKVKHGIGAGRADPVLNFGELELNQATRELRVRGQLVPLSAREFALLEALLARPGAILSRAQLEETLYGWSESVESNAVEVHIHALRKKLGADLIRNVRGVGWMIAAPGVLAKPLAAGH